MVAGESAGVGAHTVQHSTVQPSRPRCDAELDSQDAAGSRAFHLRKQHVTFALSLGFGIVPEVGRPTLRYGVPELVLRQPLPLHWRLSTLSLLPDLARVAIRIRRVAAMTQQSNQR